MIDSLKADGRIRLGECIREARKNAGLTQQELSDRCGLTQKHIWRIESGKYNVTIDTLSLISNALGGNITFRL